MLNIETTFKCPHCGHKVTYVHKVNVEKEGLTDSESKMRCLMCGKRSLFRATTRTTLVTWNCTPIVEE